MTEQERLLNKLAERVKALEEAAAPFVQAYKLHIDKPEVLSKRKAMICMSVSVGDFEKLAKVTRGEE